MKKNIKIIGITCLVCLCIYLLIKLIGIFVAGAFSFAIGWYHMKYMLTSLVAFLIIILLLICLFKEKLKNKKK